MCELAMGDRTVKELVDTLGVRQSAVSQHLGILRLGGLVERTREGSHRVYRIADPLARKTMEFLVGLASDLLARQEAFRVASREHETPHA
jgi:DNA-binding transcriptional ArsR family regulator